MHSSLVGNVVYSIFIVIKHVFTKSRVMPCILGLLQEHIGPFYNHNPVGKCTLDRYAFMADIRIPYGKNPLDFHFWNLAMTSLLSSIELSGDVIAVT